MSHQAPGSDGLENRYALIIANTKYQDAGLQKLTGPGRDARALAAVLGDPQIGGFQVEQIVVNKPSYQVSQAIEAFFAARKPADLVLLYFSGHGIKDDDGRLYLAVTDTRLNLLRSTGVSSAMVNDVMRRCRSRRQVLLLDCCYSGAFAKGVEVKAAAGLGSPMGTQTQFEGRGRVVLTASDALQYAFEGDEVRGSGAVSVFTRMLVRGLAKGEADRNRDGLVSLDELYDYVYEQVSQVTPNQAPEKWDLGVQGEIVIARNPLAGAGEAAQPVRKTSRLRVDVKTELPGGLYITRLITNPTQEGKRVTTVWVAVRGPLQYLLDSARIKKDATQVAGGVATVTVPPDAEYHFTYYDGADYTTALNPALSVGPETRRVASFTFTLTPEKPIYTLDPLYLWINYQVSDGRTGSLRLANPSGVGLELAKLIDQDVVISREADLEVVTPQGLVRGLEDQDGPACRYSPLLLSYEGSLRYYGRDSLVRLRQRNREILEQRTALHQALNQASRLAVLAEWMEKKEPYGIGRLGSDLLGGVASAKSTAILQKILESDPTRELALLALCIRHLVRGDGLLAGHVLRHKEKFTANRDALRMAVMALTAAPAGDWYDVFTLQPERSFYRFTSTMLLELMQEDLDEGMVRRIWAEPQGPLGAEVYVRGSMDGWANPPDAGSRLVYRDDGTYVARLSLPAGRHEFKIGGAAWTGDNNFGAEGEGRQVSLGEAFVLFRQNLSKNIGIEIPEAGAYDFVLDARTMRAVSVLVTASRAA